MFPRLILAVSVVLVNTDFSFSELAPISSIPLELINYFHPESLAEQTIIPGTVVRGRREVQENPAEGVPNLFTVTESHLDDAGKVVEKTCMMIQTFIKLEIRYRLRQAGVGKRIYKMPNVPDKVNGTCAMETETAKMFIFWPGFNLSLVFTKNPEGNSYYMNKAVVVYDKRHSALRQDFANSLNSGKVKLETIPDKNFFWTPLGKSYSCQEAEDQGPLKLFNVIDDEIEGTIEFSETRFQPFVKRAGGVWGDRVQCLPRSIRDTRDTMPFICATLVLLASAATIGGYGIQRTFFSDSKVGYDSYGEEKHELQQVVQRPQNGETNGDIVEETTKEPERKASAAEDPTPTANPFKQKSNPFQNYGST